MATDGNPTCWTSRVAVLGSFGDVGHPTHARKPPTGQLGHTYVTFQGVLGYHDSHRASTGIPPDNILRYAASMTRSTRITVTLPADQVAQIRQGTDNVSGFVSEAVAAQLRRRELGRYLEEYQSRYGAFTEQELAAADARLADLYRPSERLAA
jgi:post-segregation antitoxin (ccd killing protein)